MTLYEIVAMELKHGWSVYFGSVEVTTSLVVYEMLIRVASTFCSEDVVSW